MQSLYLTNPQSILDKNLNHLVEGAYLTIPSVEVMSSINKNTARTNSENADRIWQKKSPTSSESKKKSTPAAANVNKNDLNLVKTEINQKLETMDNAQQKQLKNIQYDVLNSIDGLEEILKENTALNERLSSVNERLLNLQSEVEQGKELKRQMDELQALLAEAESRELLLLQEKKQAELAEQKEAELEEQRLTSQTWFIVLMSTIPAMLIIAIGFFVVFRKKQETTKPSKKTAGSSKRKKNDEDDISVEEVEDFDEALLLDDDLSIDLLEESILENSQDNEDFNADDSAARAPESNTPLDTLDELDILDDTTEDKKESNESSELDELDALLDEINAENEDTLPPLSDEDEVLDVSKEDDIGALPDENTKAAEPSEQDDIDDLLYEVKFEDVPES
jgi:pilus assembly protein FimV